jgi:hypothetical protein
MAEPSDTIDPSRTMEMLNKFIEIYNTQHQTTGSMFDNVDPKDLIGTNDKMEMFYEYIAEHRERSTENSNLVAVYGCDDQIDNPASHPIYALVRGKSVPRYISASYISLLYHGVTTEPAHSIWSIVRL